MIAEIVELQKRELETTLNRPFIEREIGSELPDNDLITVVLGPRRAGKSLWATHTANKKETCFGYINFDHENLIKVSNYEELISAVNTTYNHPKYLLFDEIQNLPSWELFVNRLQRQGYRLIITGSNAHLLSKELATHLTGRHQTIILFPFSFNEFIRSKQVKLKHTSPEQNLLTYLKEGGFPEPLFAEIDKQIYLSSLINSLIFKDIVIRYKIRNPQGINSVVQYLLSNIASEYSFQTLSKVTELKSAASVKKYLSYLEEAFLLFGIPRFSWKIREQITTNKKIYTIDNGFILAQGFQIGMNIGPLAENSVAIKLKKMELERKIELFYWKNSTHEEVDFVIKKGNKIFELIQVSWNIENSKTHEREIRALLKAGKELKCENLLLLNEKKEGEETITWFEFEGKIRYVPLWKWLLEDK